jgi:hypothetical protein
LTGESSGAALTATSIQDNEPAHNGFLTSSAPRSCETGINIWASCSTSGLFLGLHWVGIAGAQECRAWKDVFKPRLGCVDWAAPTPASYLTSHAIRLILRIHTQLYRVEPCSTVSLLDRALWSLTQGLQAPVATCYPVHCLLVRRQRVEGLGRQAHNKRSYCLAEFAHAKLSRKGSRKKDKVRGWRRGYAHPWMLVTATVTPTTTQHDGGAKPTPRVQSSRTNAVRAGAVLVPRHIESSFLLAAKEVCAIGEDRGNKTAGVAG